MGGGSKFVTDMELLEDTFFSWHSDRMGFEDFSIPGMVQCIY